MECKKVEAALFLNAADVEYILEFESTNAKLLVKREEVVLFTDKRYVFAAKDFLKEDVRIEDEGDDFFQTLVPFLKREKRVCVELDGLTLTDCRRIHKVFPRKRIMKERMMDEMRKRKDFLQIQKIKEACRLTEKIMKEVLPYIRAGAEEAEIAAELEYRARREGARMAFPPIVLSGERTAFAHASPSPRKFMEEDLVLLDFGVKKDGYCSDVTRTYALGDINKERRKLLDAVKELYSHAIHLIREGEKIKDIVSLNIKEVEKRGFLHALCHRLGHGVGVHVHEPPSLCIKSEDKFCEGMVFTIEPGLYEERVGGARMEDVVCIMEGEVLVLTEDIPYALCL